MDFLGGAGSLFDITLGRFNSVSPNIPIRMRFDRMKILIIMLGCMRFKYINYLEDRLSN
jgi:hypothetical protein